MNHLRIGRGGFHFSWTQASEYSRGRICCTKGNCVLLGVDVSVECVSEGGCRVSTWHTAGFRSSQSATVTIVDSQSTNRPVLVEICTTPTALRQKWM